MREIHYSGYMNHFSLNAETGLITTVHPTPGNAADNLQFPQLLAHDEAVAVPGLIYTGDRAYDDTDLHARLWDQGKFSAFRLHAYRTNKKDANKEISHQLHASPDYARGVKERYKIDHKFGESKLWHRLERSRYLGLLRDGIQAVLSGLVPNLKRIVYFLMGVHFTTPIRKRVTDFSRMTTHHSLGSPQNGQSGISSPVRRLCRGRKWHPSPQ